MRVAISFAVAALLSADARAQLEMPRVDEIVEVRIINLDVVVTDERGNHVRGLTKADFEVFEDGKPQEITNFSEYTLDSAVEGSESAALPPPARRIVVFVDVVSTSTFERKRACAALAEFVDGLRAEDEVMVVSWNRRLDIVVPATSDRAVVKAGLTKVSRELARNSLESMIRDRQRAIASNSLDPMMRDRQRPGAAAAQRTAERIHARLALNELHHTATAVNAVLSRLGGVDGRKALLLVTKSFAARPQQDEDALPAEDLDAAEIIQRLTRTANAAGVTLYGVHAGGMESGMSVEDTIPGLDDVRVRSSSASIDGLRLLAGRTGGVVAANTNYFRKAFSQISADLSSYYSIAYRAHARRATGEKDVDIRTRDKRYRVRARRSLIERTFDEEIAHRVVSTLFFPVSLNDLRIVAELGSAERQKKNRYAVAVDIHIPYELLAFTPDGDSYVADLSVYISSADARGGISDVKRFDRKVRVAQDRFSTIPGKRYTYGFDVDLHTEAGNHRIAVAVLDNVSKGTGYASVDLGKLPGRRK